MKTIDLAAIKAMNGNGSSMRKILEYFLEIGATIELLHEDTVNRLAERHFLVHYQDLIIPLRAYNLNFYSVYNSALSLTITNDKLRSQALLEAWRIPVPKTYFYEPQDNLDKILSEYKDCVVKPRIGAHGEGITTHVKTTQALEKAIKTAQQIDENVLIQQYIAGNDYRLLFVDYKFVAAVKRIPATITGDGSHTIQELVELRNKAVSALWKSIRDGSTDADTTRGSISKTPLQEIINARGEAFLSQTPAKAEAVRLLDKANVSLGGQTEEVTEEVNQELTDKLSEVLENIGLSICGVDVLSTDISSPLAANASFVIELNAAPGLRLHELPTIGQSRQVCKLVADSLIGHYRQLHKK